MNQKWTQKDMARIAAEERQALGLGLMDPLDPYLLADKWGIPVYPITALVEDKCPDETIEHFRTTSSKRWSAALIPVGRSRIIIEKRQPRDRPTTIERRARDEPPPA